MRVVGELRSYLRVDSWIMAAVGWPSTILLWVSPRAEAWNVVPIVL